MSDNEICGVYDILIVMALTTVVNDCHVCEVFDGLGLGNCDVPDLLNDGDFR
jgi:hypothetical protein